MSSAAANAGACDAEKAQARLGKSFASPEERASTLSGASIAALFGQGFVGAADYRADSVDLWLDRKGNVEVRFLRLNAPTPNRAAACRGHDLA